MFGGLAGERAGVAKELEAAARRVRIQLRFAQFNSIAHTNIGKSVRYQCCPLDGLNRNKLTWNCLFKTTMGGFSWNALHTMATEKEYWGI